MTKIIVLVFVFLSFNVFATHGDNMIAAGVKSRGMAGIGLALPLGAESSLKNPALLSFAENNEFNFAATYFMPSVEATNSGTNKTGKSKADGLPVPAIGYVKNIGNNFHFGLGAYGTSGLGVDYRDTQYTDGLYKMSTSLSIMKFTPSLAYKMNDFSFGLGLTLQYGTLAISYDNAGTGNKGTGSSYDISYGFDLGFSYNFMKNMFVGLNYQSKISSEYKHQIKTASTDFALTGFSDDLDQPAEIGLGFSYQAKVFALSFDFKRVLWEDTKGYKDFKWEDQNIFTLGGSYMLNKTTLRLGYSYAKSPLQDKALKSSAAMTDYSINSLNALGFPATSESHIAFGLGHEFSNTFSMDFAFVYAPEVKETAKASSTVNLNVKHSQKSVSIGANYKF